LIDFHKQIKEDDEEEKKIVTNDPEERKILPFFKDPKIKISIWSILKESIGKDLSKITVPVFFNQPLNIL
jgi:oxysterol-binding protein 1